MSFRDDEAEQAWATQPQPEAPAAPALDTLTLEDSGVWATSSRATTPSPVVSRALIDDFDPYGPGPAPKEAVDEAALKPEPAPDGLKPPAAPPMLPSLSFSSITNVFKRGPPSATPPRSSTPEASTSKEVHDEKALGKAAEIGQTGTSPADETPFDFNRFMDQMRSKQADPIAKYLRSFLKEFSRRQWRVNDQIRVINDFLDFIAEKMRDNEIWHSVTDKEFDNAVEAMEKLVMNRLFHLTFTPALDPEALANNPTDDLERDTVLTQRIRLFSWIRERHLDLPPLEDRTSTSSNPPITPNSPTRRSQNLNTGQDYIDFAQRELRKINQYKAPRDKLITILNCCKIIFGLIRHNGGDDAGADAFVPYLIFVVLKANPDHLISNIQYIQRFRNPEKLSGETGYYLSSLTGAITFIEAMDHSSLSSITQDEFEHYVEQAIVDIETPDRVRSPANDPNQLQPRPQRLSSDFSAQAGDKDASAFLSDGLANTRDFFIRSSDLASKTMSKPLNAIGKIFTEIGQQQQESPLVPGSLPNSPVAYGAENERPRRRRGYTPSYVSGASTNPSRSNSLNVDPATGQAAAGPGFRSEDYVGDSTPAHAIQARIDQGISNQHQANLETLAAMFPSIDAEIREVVLLSSQNSLSGAIDTLLDMGLG